MKTIATALMPSFLRLFEPPLRQHRGRAPLHGAIRAHPFVDLDDALIEDVGLDDMLGEDLGRAW